MRSIYFAFAFGVFALGVFALSLSPALLAQDLTGYSQEEIMSFAVPGPEHDILKHFEGTWDYTMKINTEMKPGGAMVKSSGNGTAMLIIGGRFIMFNHNMEFMGMKGESMHIMGFDRRFKKYFMFGIDAFGTYYIISEGHSDPEKKTIKLEGIDEWPKKGGGTVKMPYRMHYTLVEPGKYTFNVEFKDKSGDYYTMVEGAATKK